MRGDFSTLWRLCIEFPSQPKLASSLPKKRLSYWRLTGCALHFSPNLAHLPIAGAGGPCFLKTCLPHLWGRGTTSVVEGGPRSGLCSKKEGALKMKGAYIYIIAAAGSVPLAIPPSPLRGPLPPRKRWGARKYIGARHPPLRTGGDHASLKLACPIYGGGGPR